MCVIVERVPVTKRFVLSPWRCRNGIEPLDGQTVQSMAAAPLGPRLLERSREGTTLQCNSLAETRASA